MRYAHTLLFVCSDCNLPISVSRISHEKNLEDVQSRIIEIRCDYCQNKFGVKAYTAKMHWVTEWETLAQC